jgi:hypothetical protein
METNWQVDAPPRPSMPGAVPARGRIAIPLDRVLDFARHDSDSRSSRPLAFALRPLLTLALATTGLFRGLRQSPPALPHTPAGREGAGGDPELLFSALSSLVEVVKTLTPSAGRVYAHLGHESLDGADPEDAGGAGDELAPEANDALESSPSGAAGRGHGEVTAATAGPRSEVVIELVSTAGSTADEPDSRLHDDAGAMAFELAVVAAIVESKGGELQLGSPGGDSRSFVVRLPVRRS